MSWILPLPLLLFAGVVALLPLATLVRRPTSALRLGFYGKTLEEALAWCLVWLMAPEIGIGPFRV